MRLRIGLVLISSFLAFVAATAQAKDLSSRLGIGYNNQFGLDQDLPSLTMRYYPNADFGVQGSIGVNTAKNDSRFGLSAKVMKIVFREDNLNFYTAASAGLVSAESNGSNSSGFELAGLAGAEFFLPGLESLGFSFEAGVGITSVSSETRFRTIGDSPLKAGIIFYF